MEHARQSFAVDWGRGRRLQSATPTRVWNSFWLNHVVDQEYCMYHPPLSMMSEKRKKRKKNERKQDLAFCVLSPSGHPASSAVRILHVLYCWLCRMGRMSGLDCRMRQL